MTLLDRHERFVGALRRAGIAVSVAEDLDAVEAVRRVDLRDRAQLRAGYAATLVKRQVHRPTFDTLFDLYFPVRSDDPRPPSTLPRTLRRDDPELVAFRAELADGLAGGDDGRLSELAAAGVQRFGAVPGNTPGAASWSSYTARSRIAPHTLTAGLLDRLLDGAERTALAERVARAQIDDRLNRFGGLLDTEVRRRTASQRGVDEVARTAPRPSVDRLDLLSATTADLAAIRREIQPLARRLASRLAVEQRRGRRGPLDFRRTIRSSLSAGGIPIETVHRPRRPHKADLVLLCDVSESVSAFARFTVLLVHAMREQFTRLRTFVFVDELAEVTSRFRPGADVVDTVGRLGIDEARGWYGRTDYGRVFGLFCERHLDALTSRATLLILGDARSNYADPALPALRTMTAQTRRAYWLNPERRSAWDTGDSVATRVGEIVPMIECRNLAQLGEFVSGLAQPARY